EIDVDLHTDWQGPRIGDVDQHLDNVDVRHIALAAPVDAARFDDRGYRRYFSGELALAKRRGADHDRLSGLDVAEVAFVNFRAHAQRRRIANDQHRRPGRRHLAGARVHLKDGRANRGTDQ